MTTVFETTNAEAAHAMLTDAYGPCRLKMRGPRPFVRLARRAVGDIALHRITIAMVAEMTGPPLGLFYLGHVLGGTITCQRRRTYRTGDVFLADQPDTSYLGETDDLDVEFAAVGAERLARVAATSPGHHAEQIRLTGFEPSTPGDRRLWIDTFTYVHDTVDAATETLEPLLLGALADLIAATALVTFPNNSLRGPTIEDRHDAHPASLRRAVAFIDDNAQRDISPAEIAAAAHVTIRALQLAFRRHLDITPLGYLRRVRLHHAHHDLLTADPATSTIGAIAARWGFINHSRFTALYRQAYGVPPSRTLRR